MTGIDMQANLFRQRRALVTVSLVLGTILYTGANVTHVEVFGTTVDLARSVRLTTPLWIALVYLAVRFHQYARGTMWREIKAAQEQRFWTTADPKAYEVFSKRVLGKAQSKLGPGQSDVQIYSGMAAHYYGPSVWRWLYHVNGVDCFDATNQRRVGLLPATPGETWTEEVLFPGRELLWHRLRAWLWIALHTHVITEYLLPLLLIAFPVGVLLFFRGGEQQVPMSSVRFF